MSIFPDGEHFMQDATTSSKDVFIVDWVGLHMLMAHGCIQPTDFLFNGTYGQAAAVLNLLKTRKKSFRLRGYARMENGLITNIGFDEIFWINRKSIPTKNDILNFMRVVKRADELTIELTSLRAWWD